MRLVISCQNSMGARSGRRAVTQAVNDYHEGRGTQTECAERYHAHQTAVSKRIKRNGLPRRPIVIPFNPNAMQLSAVGRPV